MPGRRPVAIPEAEPIDATVGARLLQMPPGGRQLNVADDPVHMSKEVDDTGPGTGFTVM